MNFEQKLLISEVVFIYLFFRYYIFHHQTSKKSNHLRKFIQHIAYIGVYCLVINIPWQFQYLHVRLLLLASGYSGIIITGLSNKFLSKKTTPSISKYDSLIEIISVIFVLLLSISIISKYSLYVYVPSVFISALTIPHIALVAIALSLLIFGINGGTIIVKAILEGAKISPTKIEDIKNRTKASNEQNEINNINLETSVELQRGLIIGIYERIIVIILSAMLAWPALGLLIAAKGLIRIKEFEDRNFAEYFLIGTLCSLSVGLVIGLILRFTTLQLW